MHGTPHRRQNVGVPLRPNGPGPGEYPMGMFFPEWLLAIADAAGTELAAGRVYRLGRPILRHLEQLPWQGLSADTRRHATLQTLVRALDVLPWGRVLTAAGLPASRDVLDVETDNDDVNPYGFRIAAALGDVGFPCRPGGGTAATDTTTEASAGYTPGGGAATGDARAPDRDASGAARPEHPSEAFGEEGHPRAGTPRASAGSAAEGEASRRGAGTGAPEAGPGPAGTPPDGRATPTPEGVPLDQRRGKRPASTGSATAVGSAPSAAGARRAARCARRASPRSSSPRAPSPRVPSPSRRLSGREGRSGSPGRRRDASVGGPSAQSAARPAQPPRAGAPLRRTGRRAGERSRKRPRPDGGEVAQPYPTRRRWHRVGSIPGERAALLEVTTAAAIERLAVGAAPKGAVAEAVGRVHRNTVDRVHEALGEAHREGATTALAALVQDVHKLRRRRDAEGVIATVLKEVRAADRTAPGEPVFYYTGETTDDAEGCEGDGAGLAGDR
ncbi:hypothetical protein BU14_0684s0002 [Porphyra umbilicalis]|uniref:Uncharacterized protein n=1 Tax=Porphyra umbilicalis TaxID=2786 RepID=A0A1X6NQ70_PORUM|nr:hypothetical protein BU14_0684s0002 [Porphyra umbilicalis]|eukprot:OSX70715.1 hypothetical protein BU14_0684s0002 [Porphyra umbilicalis]